MSVFEDRQGAGRVLTAGLGARLILLACLACLGLSRAPWAGGAVLVAFSLVQVVWPILAVSANTLSVELVPTARGESVGLFNAATAVASSLGSAIGGVIFGLYGFSALAGGAFVVVGVGLWLSATWFSKQPHTVDGSAQASSAH